MTPLKLLSLDDDVDFAQLLKARLKAPEFQLTLCHTAKDFLRLLQAQSFDLVLLDVNLAPGEPTGPQLLDVLRQRLKLSTPVIMLSHLDERSGIEACLELGADDYVTKPLDEVLLKSKIHHLLHDPTRDFDQLHVGRVPLQQGQGQLKTGVKLLSISELGLRLQAPCFVRKGALVTLKGPWPADLALPEQIKVSVSKSELGGLGQYLLTLDFDPADEECLSKVRAYLSK